MDQLNVIIDRPLVPTKRLTQILGNIKRNIKFSGNNELAGVIHEKGLFYHLDG
jgi:hypothetical protein